jgi:hypothetical protein
MAQVSAQQDPLMGRVCDFRSAARGGCPAPDWHVVAQSNGVLTGMISWNDMQSMAHADGTYDLRSRTFQMTANEVGGQGQTATVAGTIRPDGWLIANITGPNVNCQGVTVRRPRAVTADRRSQQD